MLVPFLVIFVSNATYANSSFRACWLASWKVISTYYSPTSSQRDKLARQEFNLKSFFFTGSCAVYTKRIKQPVSWWISNSTSGWLIVYCKYVPREISVVCDLHAVNAWLSLAGIIFFVFTTDVSFAILILLNHWLAMITCKHFPERRPIEMLNGQLQKEAQQFFGLNFRVNCTPQKDITFFKTIKLSPGV